MKGTNTIRFNQITMQEAVEYYLKNHVLSSFENCSVTSVEAAKKNDYLSSGDFDIVINSDFQAKTPTPDKVATDLTDVRV